MIENNYWTYSMATDTASVSFEWKEKIVDGVSHGYHGALHVINGHPLSAELLNSFYLSVKVFRQTELKQAYSKIRESTTSLKYYDEALKIDILDIYDRVVNSEYVGQSSNGSSISVQDIADILGIDTLKSLKLVRELVGEKALGLKELTLTAYDAASE